MNEELTEILLSSNVSLSISKNIIRKTFRAILTFYDAGSGRFCLSGERETLEEVYRYLVYSYNREKEQIEKFRSKYDR